MSTIITGMSGIHIEKCFTEKFFKDFYPIKTLPADQKPVFYKIDTYIEEEYYRQHTEKKKSKKVWLMDILKLTYPELEDLWNKAIDEIYTDYSQKLLVNPTLKYFLNIHSVYFHNETQEYLSLVKIEKLQQFNPTQIITFIDDIYEIEYRLTEAGGIYRDEEFITGEDIILRYLRLLDWRAKETLMSRHLAMQLKKCDHFLFAVKHPFDVFYNLTFTSKEKVYLSHPITEVRRLEKAKLSDEEAAIKKEITTISNELAIDFCPFLPTTIDEFRIYSDQQLLEEDNEVTVKRTLYPFLTERWEQNSTYNNPDNLLYIKSGFKDVNKLWKEKLPEEQEANSDFLLRNLSDFISDQVTTRDYTLVAQSDFIVIYRPLFNGNASGGVLKEFYYYIKYKKASNKNLGCFIYCPQGDIDKFYIRQFNKIIQNIITRKKGLFYKDHRDQLEVNEKARAVKPLNEKESARLLQAQVEKYTFDKNIVLEVFDDYRDREGIIIAKKITKTPLGENEIEEYKDSIIESIINSFEVINKYNNNSKMISNQVSVEEFINYIKTNLSTI